MPTKTAVLLTFGLFDKDIAKTAHGLIRYSEQYDIKGVIDHKLHRRALPDFQKDLNGGITIFQDINSFMESHRKPDFAIVAVAVPGGNLKEEYREIVIDLLNKGISIVSGLHKFLSEDNELLQAANDSGATIKDIRRPKPFSKLRFWTGEIYEKKTPILAVLGMDCAVGKRTTARMLTNDFISAGLKAEMIYTGQTGCLQGNPYGFILDATPNDFVSGELEGALLSCIKECDPDVMIIEGQSALRNPSGPCGSELLISGRANGVVLQHVPFRKGFKGFNGRFPLPSIESEIQLIESYGSAVIGVAINGEDNDEKTVMEETKRLRSKLDRPVVAPIFQGIQEIREAAENLLKKG